MVGELSQYEKFQATCNDVNYLQFNYSLSKTPKFIVINTDNEGLDTNKIWHIVADSYSGGGRVKDSSNARSWTVEFASVSNINAHVYIDTSTKTIKATRAASGYDFVVNQTYTVEIYA